MTNLGGTFAGTVLPDAFVGVPYLVGLPVALPASGTVSAAAIASFPPGLTLGGLAGTVISGTVQPTSSTSSQVDGPYTMAVTLSNAQGSTVSAALTINVHYLTDDQDASVAAQAALRAGEDIFNTNVLVGGVATNVFPTAPVIPTDLG